MTTTGENTRLLLDGPAAAGLAGDLETTIRTLDEITRRVRETFVTEES